MDNHRSAFNSIVEAAQSVLNEESKDTPTLDHYADAAYEQKGGKEEAFDFMTAPEKVAFATTALVGQVQNGGFEQWHQNGYSFTSMFLRRLNRNKLDRVGDQVNELLRTAEPLFDDLDRVEADAREGRSHEDDDEYDHYADQLDPLDRKMWSLSDSYMSEVEEFLKNNYPLGGNN